MNRYWPLLLLLAAIWGASFACIKLAVEDIEPAPMMAIRCLAAGLVLLGYLGLTSGGRNALAELRRYWRPALVLGTLNAAVPFWLVAWGETHIALTRQLSRYDSSNTASPPTVGTPTQLP